MPQIAVFMFFISLTGGCSVTATPSDFVPSSIYPAAANQRINGSVNIQASVIATGGSSYPIKVAEWVESTKFKTAIEKAIIEKGLFSRIEQGDAEYILEVWIDKVSSSTETAGEGFMIDMISLWRLTRTSDEKVLVCDFVRGHGAVPMVYVDVHRLALSAAARDIIKNGLSVLCDNSKEYLSAMPTEGLRPRLKTTADKY
jgi:hypothetical protein